MKKRRESKNDLMFIVLVHVNIHSIMRKRGGSLLVTCSVTMQLATNQLNKLCLESVGK